MNIQTKIPRIFIFIWLSLTAGLASSTTLTFDLIPGGDGSPFGFHSESGFDISRTEGDICVSRYQFFWNGLEVSRSCGPDFGGTGHGGTVSVTAAGQSFVFKGLILAAKYGGEWDIIGRKGASLVYEDAGAQSGTGSAFLSFLGNPAQIDNLSIRLSPWDTGFIAIGNIEVILVPELYTSSYMLLGIGAAYLLMGFSRNFNVTKRQYSRVN